METAMVSLAEGVFGVDIGMPEFAVGQIDPAAFITSLITGGVSFITAQKQLEAAEEAAKAQVAAAQAVVEAERLRLETERARAAAQRGADERAAGVDLIPGIPNIVLGITAAGLLTAGALKVFGVI